MARKRRFSAIFYAMAQRRLQPLQGLFIWDLVFSAEGRSLVLLIFILPLQKTKTMRTLPNFSTALSQNGTPFPKSRKWGGGNFIHR